MLTRSLKTGFVMVTVILMSTLWIACGGGGGGGGNSGGVSADSLVGTWTKSTLSDGHQTINCPGSLPGSFLDCTVDVMEFKSDGTWLIKESLPAMSFCSEIEGSWSLSGSTLTTTEIKGGSCGASKQTYAEPQVWKRVISINGNTFTESFTEDGKTYTITFTRQ